MSYKDARGVLPWKEGDELPEDRIRRHRDEMTPDEFASWLLQLADLVKELDRLPYPAIVEVQASPLGKMVRMATLANEEYSR